jgi:hypothetical protein
MLFDYRFWNSFSWTPHGLSMAYLWRIYGGSQSVTRPEFILADKKYTFC